MNFDRTFTPMKIGNMLVKNRLVVPAMDSGMCEDDGTVKDLAVDYYRARALGGFGMIILEIAAVEPIGVGMPHELAAYDDKYLPGLTKLAQGIKSGGARVVIQLHHAGRETYSGMIGQQPVAPSPIPSPVYKETPREFTTEEVYALIDKYVDAAVRSQKAGFDAVEIHSAHGYLGLQFMSPRSNKRIDEFGGGIEGRAYFLKCCIEGIHQKCGRDFPVIVRISTTEKRVGGISENEAVIYAQLLESYGAAAIDVSAGTYAAWDVIVPPSDFTGGWNHNATKRIKESVSVPVIGVGRYSDPFAVDTAIRRNECDFVALGRQSIADPDFPNKMFAGQLEEIIPCVGCTQRCMSFNDPANLQEGDMGVGCLFNPQSNARRDVELHPTDKPKKVMVVGAGPAGLEAAQVAAGRGHKVSLYEKLPANRAGGQFLLAAYPPYKQDLTKTIRYYLHKCKSNGVSLHFETEVTEALIAEEKPDVLIMATGATPVTPNFRGADKIRTAQANDILIGEAVPGNAALVIGGGLVGVETAEYCVDYCGRVAVVEMDEAIAPDMYMTVHDRLVERFREERVEVYTGTKVLELTEDGAICEREGERMTLKGFDTTIYAVGSKTQQPLPDPETLADEVYVVGDAKQVRSAVEAIYEGFRVAQKI